MDINLQQLCYFLPAPLLRMIDQCIGIKSKSLMIAHCNFILALNKAQYFILYCGSSPAYLNLGSLAIQMQDPSNGRAYFSGTRHCRDPIPASNNEPGRIEKKS